MSAASGQDGPAQCAALVRERDLDRYLVTLWAPAKVRRGLFALWALDLELMAVARTTTEPMVGAIRLAWWRERLAGLDRGEVPAQPVLAEVAAAVLPEGVSGASLGALEDGALALMQEPRELTAHVEARGPTLFAAAARLLGGAPGAAGALGEIWARGELRRLGEAVTERGATPAAPRALRPLLALARLGARDHGADEPAARGTPGRQLLIARTMLLG